MDEKLSFPAISVIIPCYRQAEELPNCIDALFHQSFKLPYEIILVDSASDPELARIAESDPRIRLVRSEVRLYCGSAKNFGAEHARAEFLAFTDADCIPGELWLQRAYDNLFSGKIAVGGPVLNALPCHPIAVTDNLLQFVDVPPGRSAGPIKHSPGCNLAMTKEVLIEAGGFGNQASGDDVELTISINDLHPGSLVFVPEMQVAHSGRKTLAGLWRHQGLFGYMRGYLGLYISEHQQRLGAKLFFLPLVMVKRLLYIFKRVIQWDMNMLLRNILLLPLILTGLLAWGIGFRQGCLEGKALQMEESNAE